MKRILALCALLCAASPAAAGGWHFVASLEGGAEFWTFTNETGDASPRRIRGNEIWVTRSDEVNTLGRDGTCDFNNCRVAVSLDGHAPQAGERVEIRFSNGDTLAFAAPGGPDLMSNYDTAGMGATNLFVHDIRRAEWVQIAFGGCSHRFALQGSAAALDAIIPYLN